MARIVSRLFKRRHDAKHSQTRGLFIAVLFVLGALAASELVQVEHARMVNAAATDWKCVANEESWQRRRSELN